VPVDFRVISIGTLAAHPLWDERGEVRTGHATTTLVSTDSIQILVDPSLPAPALLARMSERTRIRPGQITHVFLTSADALHRRAIGAFPQARWMAHEPDLAAARSAARQNLERAAGGGDPEILRAAKDELEIVEHCEAAPDSIARGVDLFPLPGVSPGCCGVLLPLPLMTVCICGDAVPTFEHLLQGKVLPGCHDRKQAQESLAEVLQIADLLVLGRDNLTVNPARHRLGV
jgi:glyoxylase-like metal-dependent hydrolase (beta-lactamase superfamily II)